MNLYISFIHGWILHIVHKIRNEIKVQNVNEIKSVKQGLQNSYQIQKKLTENEYFHAKLSKINKKRTLHNKCTLLYCRYIIAGLL